MYKKLTALLLSIIIINMSIISTSAYVTNNIYVSGRKELNSINEYIVTNLQSQIEEVANGDRSSTIFNIEYDNPTEFRNIIAKDIKYALLADNEYYLYWFDKTSDYFNISYNNTTIIVKMPVSIDYSINHVKNSFEIDTSYSTKAKIASENAKSILQSVPNNLSDYEVLMYFKNKIIELSSYAEIDDTSNVLLNYNNIFQLIYVFDNDPSTKVVCEGFSKAFKYLCDSYKFNGNVVCNIVTGTIKVNDYSEPHMWNIVSIDNQNYLVDITNSAPDCIGEYNELFLYGVSNGKAFFDKNNNFYGCYINIDDFVVYYTYDPNTINIFTSDELTLSMQGNPILYNVVWIDKNNNILSTKSNCFLYEIPINEYNLSDWNLEITDTTYTFKQINTETEDIANYMKGDLDNDGNITSADALLALRISANLLPINNYYLNTGDIDNDSLITSADALTILRISVGLFTI